MDECDLSRLRVGWGSDLHRIKPGNGLHLGGVFVACPWAFEAVSDGDVLLHALVDAILGAGALGDIGDHFPESRVRPGEDSRVFVHAALDLLTAGGGRILNADCVVDLEKPRLGSLKADIRQSIADILGVGRERVNVKAKTAEGVGPVGEGRAVSAQVTVLVMM